jgi:hypothetical protein
MSVNRSVYTFDLQVARFRVTRRSSLQNNHVRYDFVILLYLIFCSTWEHGYLYPKGKVACGCTFLRDLSQL